MCSVFAALTGHSRCSTSAEHDETKGDADHAIANGGEIDGRAKMQGRDVKSKAELVPSVGNARTAKIHPRSDGCTCTKDQQKAAKALHIGKQIKQRKHAYQAANDGPAKTEYSFLVAGADG